MTVSQWLMFHYGVATFAELSPAMAVKAAADLAVAMYRLKVAA